MGVLIYNHRKGNNVTAKTRAVTPEVNICTHEKGRTKMTNTNTINIHELTSNAEIACAISGHYSDFSADPVVADIADIADIYDIYEALQGASATAQRHAEKVELPEAGLAQRVIDEALARNDALLLDLLSVEQLEALRDAIKFWTVIDLQEEAANEAKASIDDKALISELEKYACLDGDLEAETAFQYSFWTGAANIVRAAR